MELEGDDFHDKVYSGYKSLLDRYPENVKVIDARGTVDEVFQKTIAEIERLLKA